MIKVKLKDRYIRGTVAFESSGETAIMSYIGKPTLPVNAEYTFEDATWRVIQVRVSNFNPQIVNVDLVKV